MLAAVDQVLALADRFCASSGLAQATLSTRIFNDGKRLTKLRDGGDLGTRHFAATVQWFSDHWPEEAEWPENIARPAPIAPSSSDPSSETTGN
jgi:hypothetical protein